MARGIRPRFHSKLMEDGAVKMYLALPDAQDWCLLTRQPASAESRDYARQGKSCILSLAECNWHSGLFDHRRLEDIVSSFVGSALRSHVSDSAREGTLELAYHMRQMFDDIPTYYEPCYSWATTRQKLQVLSCAYVALMWIVEALRGLCSWRDVSSYSIATEVE